MVYKSYGDLYMKQVHWTKQLTEDFIDEGMLSDDEAYLLRSRVKNTPVSIQAYNLSCSEATVHRMIAKIKEKYDIVQKANPDKFPPRRKSAKEKWMDEN